ncbi:SDR family oxidoreductase [Acidihalobacter ferrooxydans]|uniref:Dihydromonapterin reductase n=1 Tax=Acidihalobacter ferrooxydans TaxID=1765967 RepID=A0A1P8UE84_9GAMM|nr:SDR family oxidoreductase [Acidihalobacter ferrooxydans]APZ42074.1 short-chain dehydrogenase [Acidihalobacter ferrooxydans]
MYPDPILITGAGRRVGLHLAQRLLDDGAQVVAHYRTQTPDIATLQARGVTLVQGDLDSTEGALAVATAVREATPRLRAIVHNASAFTPSADEPHAAAAQYRHFFAVHMLAPWLLNTELAPLLRAAQTTPADIVHITDIFAERPNPQFDLYCSTKAGLENLSLSFAQRYAPQIKVNCIRPGPILFQPSHTPEIRANILAQIPLGHEGGAEPIYRALRALLDNDFITGAALPVDGGRHLAR